MRTKNSIYNVVASTISYVIILFLNLISKKIFISQLGIECLGLNGLFSSIISMLSIAELGIGTAIVFHLYKPLANNDKEKIKTLLQIYKKSYRVITCIILIFGIILLPFIPCLVDISSVNINIYFIFILFVVDSAVSYCFAYKRSILISDQKNYFINIVHTICVVMLNIVQISTLLLYRNFIVYLVTQIIMHLVENILISIIANNLYPFICDKSVTPLDKQTMSDIITKVKGLIIHKISSIVNTGIDNIVISQTKTLGIASVGYYTNYLLIINGVGALLNQLFSSIVSSIGNLLVCVDVDYSYKVYKKILYLNAMLCTVCAVTIFCVTQDFVTAWIGNEYLLSVKVLLVLVINFYVQEMKQTCGLFQSAAGIFYENRFVPILEIILNLFFSILLAQYYGIVGVCVGTILSSIFAHWCYSFPVFIYKKVFNKGYKDYFLDYYKFVIIFIIALVCTYYISKKIYINQNGFIKVFLKTCVSLVVSCTIFLATTFNSVEFKEWFKILYNKVKNIK